MNRVVLFFSLFLYMAITGGLTKAKTPDDLSKSLFHFNNPNKVIEYTGLIYFNNEYHLFYTEELSEKGDKACVMSHAVSSDMMKWETQKLDDSPFSVSGKITWGVFNDLAGKIGKEQESYLLNIHNNEIGLKRLIGNKWEQTDIKFNIPDTDLANIQYPHLKWSNKVSKWVLLLTDTKQSKLEVFVSKDLNEWKHEFTLTGSSCRPEFISRVSETDEEILFVRDRYLNIDLSKTIDEKNIDYKRLDYGGGYVQTLSLNKDGKTIICGGIHSDNYKGSDSSLRLTSAKEIKLVSEKLVFTPFLEGISEGKALEKSDKKLIPGLGKNLLGGKFGSAYILEGELKYDNVSSYGFVFKVGSKHEGYELRYYKKQNIYQCTGGEMAVKPNKEYSHVMAVVDNGFLDFYYDHGTKVMSIALEYMNKASKLILFNQGGELYVKTISVTPLLIKEKKK